MPRKSPRYQVHQSVLDEVVRPYSNLMIARGASRRWSETALTYISNKFLEDSFQPQSLNTGKVKELVRVIPLRLVEAGILQPDGNYKAGHHCYPYLLTHEYQAEFQEAFCNAVQAGEERFDVRFGLVADNLEFEEPEEELVGIEDVINQLNFDADVDLVGCVKFVKDPTVLMYLAQYISKLKSVEMSINVEEVRAGIQHGLQLIRKKPVGSGEAARGWSYVYTGQAILDKTDSGVYRPNYILREFRFFESGFQQYPSKYNKMDLIDDPDYVNLDQVSSHAAIILQMMVKLGMKAGPLHEYVEERDGVAKRLGLDLEALKKAVNAYLNGAKATPKSIWSKKTGEALSCFAPFLETYGVEDRYGSKDIAQAIERYQAFVRWIHPLKKSVKNLTTQAEKVLTSPRREGANLGYIAQVVELLHKVIFVETNRVQLVGDAHDGIVLDTFGIKHLNTKKANQITGYDMDYKKKPLGSSRKGIVEQYVQDMNKGPSLPNSGELTARALRANDPNAQLYLMNPG